MDNMYYGYHRITAGGIFVTAMQAEHAEGVAMLQAELYPQRPPSERFSATDYAQHIEQFPSGQMVALDFEQDRVAGAVSGLLTDTPPEQVNQPQRALIGDTRFAEHNPSGQWLHTLDLMIHPDYAGEGIGTQFMQMRFEVVRGLGIMGMWMVQPLTGYAAHQDTLSEIDYAQQVLDRQLTDPAVEAIRRMGLESVGVVADYFSATARHTGAGIVMRYRNPERLA